APDELERAATLLNAASKVTILAGAGAEGAHDEVVALADRLAAPVVHALRGKEFVEYDNPFDVGMTGLLGFASGYRAMEGADALLILGSDFPYPQFYPADATTIQVDIRGENLGRRHPLDLGLVGDVGATAAALLPRLKGDRRRAHLDDATAHYRKTRAKLDELAVPSRGKAPIHPQYLARLLDEAAADDAVFTADVGSPTVWAARYLHMNGKRRLIGSFNHGSMANALLHGIGAQASEPDRQVVALAGDGGLTMMLGELISLTQNDLPVKTIVVNNSSLNFVELEMKAAGFVNYGTELRNPDFAAVAEAMGIFARRVERSEDLPAALAEVLAHDGPALLDVVTERQELSMPPAVNAEQVKGFALYAIRTVLSGRGDELLDLAKANWRQLF
ncbi:thiamine pyrophosphate-dependent enzyme, partial [Microbacterium azadirachtae]|uniref:thiamine pyrophosphate-dependent enzyme n=1 Tax=Microbacterium azadirachtae TaxID=582680 RepID=UPI003F756DFA